jgi:phage terminase large subunit
MNGIYQERIHNRTDHVFKIQESTVEFFSLDAPGKARGPRRDILFINEANLVPLETYRQLELRTRKAIYLDYNPVDEFHWIYDELVDANRSDVTFIKSTYKQNTFLSPREIANIERYESVDENYWRVYGLGERGSSRATVYTTWELCDTLPEGGEEIWGMDFGFNDPAAMVQVKIHDDDIYVREQFYQSRSTNADRIRALQEMDVTERIYADSSQPEFISEIYSAGFDIHRADKDVKKGLDTIRSRRLFITRDSINLIKEIKSYKYREDANGRILEEPVKLNDHLMDAMRYAVHTYFGNPDYGKYAVL